MDRILSGLTGLCAGIVSGAALCAFYVALGVFSKSALSLHINAGKAMALSSVSGGLLGTVVTIFGGTVPVGATGAVLFGLFGGMYIGIVIACLAEVTDAIPIIKNYGLSRKAIVVLLTGFVLGKTAGSFIYWLSGVF